jgi:hypothetical protein
MIKNSELITILERAYVPEQVTDYVTAVSGAEPFLFEDFIAYRKEQRLIFIGYPLADAFKEKKVKRALDDAIRRFKPIRVALTAPCLPASVRPETPPSFDQYYRLDLASLAVSQKVRNMINRAERRLKVEKRKTLTEAHQDLVREFLRVHPVAQETQFIFERLPDYLSSTGTAWAFDVRSEGGNLVGFDVVEMAAKAYAFYMFNFTSRDRIEPGASDLLLWEIIRYAKGEDKRYLNLGLGINPGVTFFKEKWGGKPFLPYAFVDYAPAGDGQMEELLQKL